MNKTEASRAARTDESTTGVNAAIQREIEEARHLIALYRTDDTHDAEVTGPPRAVPTAASDAPAALRRVLQQVAMAG